MTRHRDAQRAGIWANFARMLLVVAALFVSQSLAASHEAEFGNAPHEHDGVVCTMHVASDRWDIAPCPDPVTLAAPQQAAVATEHAPQATRYRLPIKRGPPPRAPPHQTFA